MIRLIKFFLGIKIIRFLVSGGSAAAVHLALLFFLTDIIGLWYIIATSIAFCVAFVISFTLQKFWTFRDTRTHVIPRQLIVYFGVATGMLIINAFCMYILVDIAGLWYLLAQFFVSGAIAVANFIIYNTRIFVVQQGGAARQNFPYRYVTSTVSQPKGEARTGRYTRIFIGEPISGLRPLRILFRHLGLPHYKGEKPFRAVYEEMDFSFLVLEKNPAHADFFFLPHSYFLARYRNTPYVEKFLALARKHGKKTILFVEGDTTEWVREPDTIVFRTSQYAHNMAPNEIIMPPQVYAGDVLSPALFHPRAKRGKPVVSFCGWAETDTARQKVRLFLGNALADFKTHILRFPYASAEKQGLYFRKRALAHLAQSPLVEPSFIVRDFFSVNKHTIKRPREELRAEYLKNIIHSDFVLAPRGDGNFSIRFYEALALGRIPVLIDTGSILPFEKEIDYESCIVRVPHTELHAIDKHIARFYNRLNTEQYGARSRAARELFENHLRVDMFLRNMFEKFAQ